MKWISETGLQLLMHRANENGSMRINPMAGSTNYVHGLAICILSYSLVFRLLK